MSRANVQSLDLRGQSLRDVNAALQSAQDGHFRIAHPDGAHALAVGLSSPIEVEIAGHTGYYTAGMNQEASLTIHGNAGPGLAENMMSGTVRVTGNASQYAGATGHGGLLVIAGDASSRCGISMKGIDIVVGGNVGHMSAFMGQAGRLVVLGDAGADFGDSLYEARLYVRGEVKSLGADCIEKPIRDEHRAELAELLAKAGMDADPASFRRYGSARKLYTFTIDDAGAVP
jgi:glutamate synthase domain-containing protein 3